MSNSNLFGLFGNNQNKYGSRKFAAADNKESDEAKDTKEKKEPSMEDAQSQNAPPVQAAPPAPPIDSKAAIRQNLQLITQGANNLNDIWFGMENAQDMGMNSQMGQQPAQPGIPMVQANKPTIAPPPNNNQTPNAQNPQQQKAANLGIGSQVPNKNWGPWYGTFLRNRVEQSKSITGK